MIKTIYLAGPIDLGGDLPNWRSALKTSLDEDNFVLFDPASAFKLSQGYLSDRGARYIETINNAAIDAADLVICSLPAGVQTVGTILEIDKCYRDGKRLILVTNINVQKSAYLLNRTRSNTEIVPFYLFSGGGVDVERTMNFVAAKIFAPIKEHA